MAGRAASSEAPRVFASQGPPDAGLASRGQRFGLAGTARGTPCRPRILPARVLVARDDKHAHKRAPRFHEVLDANHPRFVFGPGSCRADTAAAPAQSPQPPSMSLNIRTAGDLAGACTVTPTNKASFASLNFCNGFAQGILQTNAQDPNGTKICIPNPSPKRSETMKEFAGWARADVSRKGELASVAFLRFMAGRFRCT
jgi:Rap1a immunity proteins